MRKYTDRAAIDRAVTGYDAIAGRPKPVPNEEIEFVETTRIEQKLDSFPGSEFSLSMHFGYFFFTAPKNGSCFNLTKFCDDISHVRGRLRLHFSRPPVMTCCCRSRKWLTYITFPEQVRQFSVVSPSWPILIRPNRRHTDFESCPGNCLSPVSACFFN
jgi:hypothetical protein